MWDKTEIILAGAGDGSWFWSHPGWYGSMGMHGLFWLVFLVLAVIAVVVVVRSLAARSNSDRRERAPRESALAILEARYARGGIKREEFLAMKQDLTA